MPVLQSPDDYHGELSKREATSWATGLFRTNRDGELVTRRGQSSHHNATTCSPPARPGGQRFVGTPASIADKMQAWLESDACDGFNIMFPTLPGGLDGFVDMLVPELQGRGLFRKNYEGTTLREHLGLPRPPNRFFAA